MDTKAEFERINAELVRVKVPEEIRHSLEQLYKVLSSRADQPKTDQDFHRETQALIQQLTQRFDALPTGPPGSYRDPP
jgi:hypothetical protein